MLDRRRGTVRDLRRDTRSALLWSLYFNQPRGRPELSEATGLSQASVSNVVRELLDEGIVIEAGSVESDGADARRSCRPRCHKTAIERARGCSQQLPTR